MPGWNEVTQFSDFVYPCSAGYPSLYDNIIQYMTILFIANTYYTADPHICNDLNTSFNYFFELASLFSFFNSFNTILFTPKLPSFYVSVLEADFPKEVQFCIQIPVS